MHSTITYLAVNHQHHAGQNQTKVIEALGKFAHVNDAIASFNARFNSFEHSLMAYQSNAEKTAITRLFHINSDKLLTRTLH